MREEEACAGIRRRIREHRHSHRGVHAAPAVDKALAHVEELSVRPNGVCGPHKPRERRRYRVGIVRESPSEEEHRRKRQPRERQVRGWRHQQRPQKRNRHGHRHERHVERKPLHHLQRHSAAAQEDAPDSLLNFYRAAIALRKRLAVVRDGRYVDHEPLSGSLYVYSREDAKEKLLVVCSFVERPVHFRAPRGFELGTSELLLKNYDGRREGNGFVTRPYECRVYHWDK